MGDPRIDDSDPTEGTAAGPGNLDGVPQFARDSVPWQNVHETPAAPIRDGNSEVVADVDPKNDTQINVRDASQYTPGTRAHEATHVAQFTRQDGVVPNKESGEMLATSPDAYQYQNLASARAKGQTMANMTQEQQAAIVGDYLTKSRAIEAKARAGQATTADEHAYSELQNTYHPWIRDLAPQPKGNTINTHPEAPGLPPADTPGLNMLAPDKLMGGSYVPILKHGQGEPLSKADATRYLAAANGNKQVARAFAHHDQHTF